MQRRDIAVSLGGISFKLKYEAENLYALSEITGTPWFQYIRQTERRAGESFEDVAARCSDVSMLVPILMAGMAHLDEYCDLTHRQLRRKVCQLLDKEAAKRNEPLLGVTAELFARVMPFLASTIVPPGTDMEKMKDELDGDTGAKGGPAKRPLGRKRRTSTRKS